MSTSTVLQFMQKTSEDEALRHRLEELLGVGDGNISSEAELDAAESEALKGELAPVVANFATQSGYDFSVEDLVMVVDAFQKHQTGELSDLEFSTLLGLEKTIGKLNQATGPLKRLTKYLSKTYLGIQA
jgi:hypothetical protein